MEITSPSLECFNIFLRLSDFVTPIGGNIMDTGPNGPPNKFTYIMYTLLALNLVMTCNAIHYTHNDFVGLAFSLVTFGFTVQGFVKLYVIIGCRVKIRNLISTAQNFIVGYEANSRLRDIFDRYNKFCNFCRPLVLYLYAISGVSVISVTIAIGVWTKTKILPFGFMMPFIDHTSDGGYALNFMYMLIVTVYAVYGLFASDFGFLCFMAMACSQVETIGQLCKDLTDYLELHGSEDLEEIQKLIILIATAQRSHTNYMKNLEDSFGIHSFIIIASSMIAVAITIFVFIQHFWLNGIMIATILMWQIFAICTVGGIYMIKVDQVMMEINETKWYLLPWRNQKIFINIIHNAQHPVEPSAMGRLPLNFETFVNCIKMMYQFLMLLLNMSN
ncbi:hypothetical protein DMENIID0001_100240 [Sergentomyia squamirostris]